MSWPCSREQSSSDSKVDLMGACTAAAVSDQSLLSLDEDDTTLSSAWDVNLLNQHFERNGRSVGGDGGIARVGSNSTVQRLSALPLLVNLDEDTACPSGSSWSTAAPVESNSNSWPFENNTRVVWNAAKHTISTRSDYGTSFMSTSNPPLTTTLFPSRDFSTTAVELWDNESDQHTVGNVLSTVSALDANGVMPVAFYSDNDRSDPTSLLTTTTTTPVPVARKKKVTLDPMLLREPKTAAQSTAAPVPPPPPHTLPLACSSAHADQLQEWPSSWDNVEESVHGADETTPTTNDAATPRLSTMPISHVDVHDSKHGTVSVGRVDRTAAASVDAELDVAAAGPLNGRPATERDFVHVQNRQWLHQLVVRHKMGWCLDELVQQVASRRDSSPTGSS
jgi:hypothetical protein